MFWSAQEIYFFVWSLDKVGEARQSYKDLGGALSGFATVIKTIKTSGDSLVVHLSFNRFKKGKPLAVVFTQHNVHTKQCCNTSFKVCKVVIG